MALKGANESEDLTPRAAFTLWWDLNEPYVAFHTDAKSLTNLQAFAKYVYDMEGLKLQREWSDGAYSTRADGGDLYWYPR